MADIYILVERITNPDHLHLLRIADSRISRLKIKINNSSPSKESELQITPKKQDEITKNKSQSICFKDIDASLKGFARFVRYRKYV
jgi:hypothetical protein